MKVFKFGSLPPLPECRDLAEYELQGAHRYFNAMIEVARAQLERKHALQLEHMPGLAEAEAECARLDGEIETVRKEIKAKKAVSRKRAVAAEDKQRIDQLVAARKEAVQQRHLVREPGRIASVYIAAAKKLTDDLDREPTHEEVMAAVSVSAEEVARALPYMQAVRELYVRGLAENRRAYAAAQCFWGTRLQVMKAVEAACEGATHVDLPNFRRWTGDGQMTVQLQGGGITIDELFAGSDNRIQFAKQNKKPGDRMGIFRLRIGSNGREPVWLSIPMVLPKKFGRWWPADGRIIWASVVRRRGPMLQRRGDDERGFWTHRDEWSVQLTVKTGAAKTVADGGMCAVDLGWRRIDDETTRVAYVVGDDGKEEELTLDPRPWFELDAIQSDQDKRFDELRDSLAAWLAEHRERLSPELREETAMLNNWKSRRRMCKLVANWERVDGDDQVWQEMLRWRRDEAELDRQAHNLRTYLQAKRKDDYRVFAAGLAKHYRTIVICGVDKVNIAETKRLPAPESGELVNTTAQRNANIASPGKLREIIVASGAKIQLATLDNATILCHACGTLDEFDRAAEIVHTCSQCGAMWDQDANKARNMLASAQMVNETPRPARDAESEDGKEDKDSSGDKRGRWQRRKRKPLGNDDEKTDAA